MDAAFDTDALEHQQLCGQFDRVSKHHVYVHLQNVRVPSAFTPDCASKQFLFPSSSLMKKMWDDIRMAVPIIESDGAACGSTTATIVTLLIRHVSDTRFTALLLATMPPDELCSLHETVDAYIRVYGGSRNMDPPENDARVIGGDRNDPLLEMVLRSLPIVEGLKQNSICNAWPYNHLPTRYDGIGAWGYDASIGGTSDRFGSMMTCKNDKNAVALCSSLFNDGGGSALALHMYMYAKTPADDRIAEPMIDSHLDDVGSLRFRTIMTDTITQSEHVRAIMSSLPPLEWLFALHCLLVSHDPVSCCPGSRSDAVVHDMHDFINDALAGDMSHDVMDMFRDGKLDVAAFVQRMKGPDPFMNNKYAQCGFLPHTPMRVTVEPSDDAASFAPSKKRRTSKMFTETEKNGIKTHTTRAINIPKLSCETWTRVLGKDFVTRMTYGEWIGVPDWTDKQKAALAVVAYCAWLDDFRTGRQVFGSAEFMDIEVYMNPAPLPTQYINMTSCSASDSG